MVSRSSTPAVLEAVAHQARLGAPIAAETCPQYLMLREEEVATLGDHNTPLMIDAALSGQTSLERVVAAYAIAPARRYRLKGKGEIAVGRDADLALVDPEGRWTLEDASVRSKAGWTHYAGREVHGRVAATVLGGRVVARDGCLLEPEPSGRPGPGPGPGLDPAAAAHDPLPAG